MRIEQMNPRETESSAVVKELELREVSYLYIIPLKPSVCL